LLPEQEIDDLVATVAGCFWMFLDGLEIHGKAWSLAALPSEDYLSYRGAHQEPLHTLTQNGA